MLPSQISTGIEPLPLGKFKRLRVRVAQASTASSLVEVFNADNDPGSILAVNVTNLGDVFRKLGFDVDFQYTAVV